MIEAIDKSVVGTYTITYSAADNAKNKANSVTREVTIAPKTVILTPKDKVSPPLLMALLEIL